MSKKKPRSPRSQATIQRNNLELQRIVPLTATQKHVFDSYADGMNLMLHGFAGTGKSFVSCYLAMEELEANQYEKVVIIRSVVPSRDVGFLPGSLKEKTQVYEKPYSNIFGNIYNRGDAWQLLKDKQKVEFETTSFLRGCTIDNAIIIVDEVQNLSWIELYTVLTRVGDNARVILCGDLRQSDLRKNESGLNHMMNILKKMRSISFIEFSKDDIVRSNFVKELIIKSAEYQDNNEYM